MYFRLLPRDADSGPKVSVIMAVYNAAQYVGQAIDSILAQTFTNFEFLVVNDGSTDDTYEILYAYDDPRISILTNENNVGLAKSLNRGISKARGEYIARQDADDSSHPERIMQQARYLDEHPEIGVVGAATRWMDGDDNLMKIWPLGQDNAEIQKLLISTCPLIHGSTMFRRQCFEEIGGYDTSMRTGQDYDFWLRISETWDMTCLRDVLYTYRWHPGMASIEHKEEQARHAEIGRARAIQRRVRYVGLALGQESHHFPPRLLAMSRRQLAQRYIWWSAGARELSKKLALQFLLVGWLFDPSAPQVWSYMRDILMRKISLGGK
jgi:glycosyltransferase involved in cell wall biosynthesis